MPPARRKSPWCSRKRGERQHPRIRAAPVLPGGGTSYVYQVGGGTLTYNIPPKSFDALAASPQQLREYNLPSKKLIGAKRWYLMMRKLMLVAPPKTLIQGPASTALTVSQADWAGISAYGQSNYNAVSADWTEASIGSSVCSPDAEATWVGLGGNNGTSDLGQDGTTYGLSHHPRGPFWQVVTGSGTNVSGPNWQNWTASAGDQIAATVTYSAGSYIFTLADETSHKGMSPSYSTSVYSGTSAEMVVEWPFKYGYDLSNFGTIPVTDASATAGSTTKPLAGFPTWEYDEIWDARGPWPRPARRSTAAAAQASTSAKATATNQLVVGIPGGDALIQPPTATGDRRMTWPRPPGAGCRERAGCSGPGTGYRRCAGG